MTKWTKLSYDLGINTPLYPDTPPIQITQHKSIIKGDSSNSFMITFSNHSGTHIDAPKHFWQEGKSINDYSINDLIFYHPMIADCPKKPTEVIEIDDLKALPSDDTDILLIRTGIYTYRQKDPETYSYKNPCVSPKLALYLRENFPNLRAIGLDSISVASRSNRSLGKETHQILLDETRFDGPALLILEDMDLSRDIKRIKELIVSPLFIDGVDSAPVTVFGVLIDD